MKIALIQPAKPDDKSVAARGWSLCRPLSLIYLSCAISKSQLHESEIFDLELIFASQNDLDLEKMIASLDFDAFGVTSTTFTRHEAAAVIKLIRKFHKGKYIIVGGVHFSHCDIDTLTNIPEVDVVVRGEGEITLVELLNALETSTPLVNIKGISYRDASGEIRKNPDADVFENLDSLDIYNFKSPKEYPEFLMGSSDPIPAVSVMTSRGCPYKCIFCAKAGVKYRHRLAQNVIRELKYYIDEHGITSFNFLDLTFTANPQRSKELCQAIIDEGLEIQWWCETRANVPLELVTLMHKAGCRYIVVGVETGSASVLERIQKGVTLDQVETLFRHTRKLGVDTTGYFVCSHVGETYDDALKTLKFIYKIERMYGVSVALQACMIFPGTEVENIAKATNRLPESFSWADNYENPSNAELGQVTTIPLFFDRLTHEDIANIIAKFNNMRQIQSRYKDLSVNYLRIALKAHGPRKLLKMLLDDFRAITYFKL